MEGIIPWVTYRFYGEQGYVCTDYLSHEDMVITLSSRLVISLRKILRTAKVFNYSVGVLGRKIIPIIRFRDVLFTFVLHSERQTGPGNVSH